jgi:4a-hydroxytetrahydrobiopterin dehydratase
MNATCTLTSKTCLPCEGGIAPLSSATVDALMSQLAGWEQYDHLIGKTFHFKNYHETMAFVNALAWLSHRENHHPDLSVHYNRCHVEYTTHAINGLSENDFICAAKVDALFNV